ncbi:hypothetical protein QQS21_012777 [Conoideocrella luteorostrata]|uniref:NAD(P)-binding protein n=1 Tax=Conoideocrella luteorostrata TaxID=1105319 RepID=A0AAJ0CAV5_9HYPO|nr:hypothetical protein QQS21_012777 [Conoideocrella luteorostrata]
MPSSQFSLDSIPDLTGRVYLVTGGNTGIGLSTVIGLASQGAKVYMGCRSEVKARAAIDEIEAQIKATNVHFLSLDLSSFNSVLSAASEIKAKETALHGLINNAGIMGVPFEKTDDGYEVQFQTNYMSHWLLTYHLLPILTTTGAANQDISRIVNVTSDGHERFAPACGIKFNDIDLKEEGAMTRYGQSKLANVLHVKELNRKYGPSSTSEAHLCVAAVHPGHIDTHLNKQATGTAPGMVLRLVTPIMRCVGILDDRSKGALSSIFAIASEGFKAADSGAYVVPYAKIGTPSALALDQTLATELWNWTEKELGSKGFLQ